MIISRNIINKNLVLSDRNHTTVDSSTFIKYIDFYRSYLVKNQLVKGSFVLIISENCIELLALMIACFETGVVPLFATEHQLERTDFFINQSYNGILYAEILSKSTKIISLKESYNTISFPYVATDEALLCENNSNIVVEENDIAICGITTGTTGNAKLVFHTHKSISIPVLHAVENIYKNDSTMMVIGNLNHLGIITVLVLPMLMQAKLGVISQNYTDEALTLLQKHSYDTANIFTVTLDYLKKHLKNKISVKKTIHGGYILEKSAAADFINIGVEEICSVYGTTEMPPPVMVKRVNVDNLESYERTYLGEPIPGYEFNVVNNTLHSNIDSIGFNKDFISLKNDEGYYDTGDIVTEENNKLYYQGRYRKPYFKNGKAIEPWVLDKFLLSEFGDNFMLNNIVLPHEFNNSNGDSFVSLSLVTTNKIDLQKLESINNKISKANNDDFKINYVFIVDEIPNTGLKKDLRKVRELIGPLVKELSVTDVIYNIAKI